MVGHLPPSEVVSFIDRITEYHFWVPLHPAMLDLSIPSCFLAVLTFFSTTGPGRLDTVFSKWRPIWKFSNAYISSLLLPMAL